MEAAAIGDYCRDALATASVTPNAVDSLSEPLATRVCFDNVDKVAAYEKSTGCCCKNSRMIRTKSLKSAPGGRLGEDGFKKCGQCLRRMVTQSIVGFSLWTTMLVTMEGA